MATKIQVTIDCADPERLARFWADALGYKLEDAPTGFATWRSYWRSVGIPEDELGDGDCNDSIVDPAGSGPRIWFQAVPERKTVKNRLHLDLDAGGGRAVPLVTRKLRVEAEAERLAAAGATRLRELEEGGGYFVVMHDPEGNEFCIH